MANKLTCANRFITSLICNAHIKFGITSQKSLSNKENQISSLVKKILKSPPNEERKKQMEESTYRVYTPETFSSIEDFSEILTNLEIYSVYFKGENLEEYCKQLGDLLHNCIPQISPEKKLSPFCQRVLYYMAKAKDLVNTAKIVAVKTPLQLSKSIRDYGITDQDDLAQIAKIAAAEPNSAISYYIQNYGITDQKDLIEIAKIAAAQPRSEISLYIQNYKIKDQKAIVEIAKIATQTDATSVFFLDTNYKITDQQGLVEIGKIAATHPLYFSTFIEKYKITDPKDGIEIAKIVAVHSPGSLSQCISAYKIRDQKALIEIMTMGASHDGQSITRDLYLYRITDIHALLNIYMIALENSPVTLVLKDLIKCIKTQFEKDPLSLLLSLQDTLDTTKLPPFIEAISQKTDPRIKKHLTIWLCFFLLKSIQEKPSTEILNLLFERGFMQAIFDYRDPLMRFELLKDLFLFAKNRQAIEWKSPGVTPRTCLPSLLAALLNSQGVDPIICVAVVNISNQRIFKDSKNLKLYVNVLHLIVNSSKLSVKDKNALCLCLANASKDIVNHLYKLQGIFALNNEELLTEDALEKAKGDLNVILENSFKALFSLEGIPDLSARILKHFEKARIPYYISIYFGILKKLPEPEQKQILPKLSECVKMILGETVVETRYTLEGSLHLKTLFATRPSLLEGWKQGASIPFVPSQETTPCDFDIKTFLVQRLVQDNHFEGDEMENFTAFLQGSLSKEAFLSRTEILNPSLKTLQRICLELIEAPLEAQGDILKKLSALVQDFPKGKEFQNDIQALIKSLTPKTYKEEGWILTDTDAPQDLFLAGTEIEGSCQRITGDPYFNKCLLAYVLDGKNRLLALKDSTGKILARCIIRLLWNKQEPVLFLERLYPANAPSKWKKALENFALQRAAALGLSLTSSEFGKGTPYPLRLSSLSSKAPYEYSDGGGGVTTGIFSISHSHVIEAAKL